MSTEFGFLDLCAGPTLYWYIMLHSVPLQFISHPKVRWISWMIWLNCPPVEQYRFLEIYLSSPHSFPSSSFNESFSFLFQILFGLWRSTCLDGWRTNSIFLLRMWMDSRACPIVLALVYCLGVHLDFFCCVNAGHLRRCVERQFPVSGFKVGRSSSLLLVIYYIVRRSSSDKKVLYPL